MMRLRSEVGIGPRLLVAFLSVALLALTSGLAGLVGLRRASTIAATVIRDAQMIQTIQEIRVAVSPVAYPPDDFLLTGNAEAPAQYAAAVAEARARLATYEQVHNTHRHSAAHAESAQRLMAATRADIERMAQLQQTLFTGERTAEQAAALAELDELIQATTGRLEQLLQNAREDVQLATAARAAAERNAFIGLAATAFLAVGLALGLAIAITRSISLPLADLARAADRIADGDLASPITVTAAGEIGQLATDLENMRQTLRRERGQLRLLAVLQERDRIGREMHDGLAQVLGYVNTKAQAVGEFLRAGQPQLAEQHIEELVAAAREAYVEAREAIDGLRLDGVAQRGLSEVLSESVAQFRRRTELAVELVIAPTWDDDTVPSTVQVQLLRIVQEALTNVRKHAGGTRVEIELAMADGEAQVTVDDDGDGFNLSRLLRPGYTRYGLRTMRERAQAVGGTFRIASQEGQGTCITVRAPLAFWEEPQ